MSAKNGRDGKGLATMKTGELEALLTSTRPRYRKKIQDVLAKRPIKKEVEVPEELELTPV